jgi:MOSC domain-containing protein YiiM
VSVSNLHVRGVFVGLPAELGEHGGAPVRSAIRKARVAQDSLALDETNLDGDRQADLKHHGGPDKALYVYPAEHYSQWRDESFELEPGDVGENVSVAGAVETQVRIGDTWRWGEAVIQVTQPREPCFKLGMRTGRKELVAAMVATSRCGWYTRVLTPGAVPTAGEMTLLDADPASPTIAEVYALLFPAHRKRVADLPGLYRKAIAAPALAERLRRHLERNLAKERF